jgi:hypothetical protein
VDVSKGRAAALTARMALVRVETLFEEVAVPVVHVDGISHGIMLPEHPMYNFLKRTAARPDRWRTVTHVLEDLGIIDKPASGLIFVERSDAGIGIIPYVFVKAISTLYPEMACASGSVALACILGNVGTNKSEISIRQPSGEDLDLKITPIAALTEIKVAGSMSIRWDGPAGDLHYSAAALSGRHGSVIGRQRLRQARAAL